MSKIRREPSLAEKIRHGLGFRLDRPSCAYCRRHGLLCTHRGV